MKRYLPDPSELVTALAGRVDVLEHRTRILDQDLTALGRGVADLNAQLRRVTQQSTARPSASGPAAVTDDALDEEDAGQRDWLAVTDPAVAVQWLEDAERFADDVLDRHGLTLAHAPCWPLHPDTVTEVLALVAQREEAYAGSQATPVSEWLTRWLPAACDRIREQLGRCLLDRAHYVDGHSFDARDLPLPHAARWWCLARHAPAHTALRLPQIR